MGTFPICKSSLLGKVARISQKGTYLEEVCPLLLANGECPHFPIPPESCAVYG